MNEKMEKALLECCERHTSVLSQEVIDFMYDLAQAAIETSETPIDNAFLPIITATKPLLEKTVANLVDKIDGVEGNTEEL